jgi:RHS repeat-associated protein
VFNRFRLDLSTSGSTLTIKVYYNGAYKFTATDGSPFAAGSVGMIGGYNLMYWDNVVAMTNVNPATVVSYDDYDGWGMILEGRSAVNGDGRPRFKFTGKERDAESKYDYFGARYYDSRVGRWMSVDPLARSFLSLSPFAYCSNSPTVLVDQKGMAPENKQEEEKIRGLLVQPLPTVPKMDKGKMSRPAAQIVLDANVPARLPVAPAVADRTGTSSISSASTSPAREVANAARAVADVSAVAGLGVTLAGMLGNPELLPVGNALLQTSFRLQVMAVAVGTADVLANGGEPGPVLRDAESLGLTWLGGKAIGSLAVKPTTVSGPAFYNASNGRFLPNSIGYGAVALPDAAALYLNTREQEHDR